jgi:bifunctional lysine-specific demethylase and histidyl-hydroxylase NO66
VLAESTYTRHATIAGQELTGLVHPRTALELFRDGATIVLQGLHRYHPPLADLVAELELALGHPCQANAYLTPPGSQGFAVHQDSHDVFVFQTAGSKEWEVHDGEGGVERITMEPGLSLYLPTGTPHAARAQETVSLHVTIGINQLTWRDLVRRSVTDLLPPADHLPAGYLDDPAALRDGLATRLRRLAERIERLDPGEIADDAVRRFLTGRAPRLTGGLHDVLAEIEDDTLLRRRQGHPCVLIDHEEGLELLLGDRSITMPAWLRPAIEDVRASTALRPGDLPLSEQARLVLCRRLVREGLLEVAR